MPSRVTTDSVSRIQQDWTQQRRRPRGRRIRTDSGMPPAARSEGVDQLPSELMPPRDPDDRQVYRGPCHAKLNEEALLHWPQGLLGAHTHVPAAVRSAGASPLNADTATAIRGVMRTAPTICTRSSTCVT